MIRIDFIVSIILFMQFLGIDGKEMFGNPDEWGDKFDGDIRLSMASRSTFKGDAYYWPNATVPYEFHPSFNKSNIEIIMRALKYYEDITNDCVVFEKRTDEFDYIVFVDTHVNCFSFVGNQGGPQEINLPTKCIKVFGTILHELFHVLGFFHEHMRQDRNKFVKILWENVAPGKEAKFNITNIGIAETPYDYESIMHSSPFAFSANGKRTVETTDPKYSDLIGQRKKLSRLDILGLQIVYDCPWEKGRNFL